MIAALILGLITGSFTGVVCYRIPRNESIIFPGSKCDRCAAKIAFYRNIPVFSFLLQHGKCHSCGIKIKRSYFILEILTPVLFLILYFSHGFSIIFFYKAFVYSILLAASFIDIETHIIPDRFFIILLITGFLYSVLRNNPENWFLGAASYGLPVLLLYSASDFINKEIQNPHTETLDFNLVDFTDNSTDEINKIIELTFIETKNGKVKFLVKDDSIKNKQKIER